MIVENIRKLCQKQGTTLAELERVLGLGNGAIGKWNKNSPSVTRLKAVADYFGVTVDSLLRQEAG